MRLPDFLVIGAMKSGTTALYQDLAAHPQVFLAKKELGTLARDVSMTDYASNFRGAKINQLCGDVSAAYSMLPDVSGVAERASRGLSPNSKIIYLVREPVERAIRHHYHACAGQAAADINGQQRERMGPDFDECVRKHPSLTNYGMYGEQLEQWLRCWGPSRVLVLPFDEYMADRQSTMARVFYFLGLRPAAANTSEHAGNRFVQRMAPHRLIRRIARRRSTTANDQPTAALTTPAPLPPRPETIDHLVSVFAADSERLRQLVARSTPFWDFAAVGAAHCERYRQWQAATGARTAA